MLTRTDSANEQEGNAISQILHGLPLAPSLMGSSSCTSTVRSTTLLDTTTSLRRHATLRNSLALVDAATDEIVDVLQLEQGPSGGGGVPAVMARTDSQATSTSTGAETQVSDSTTLVDGLPPRPARVVAPPPTSSPSKLERLFADENAQPPAPPPKDVEHTGGMRQAERSTGAAEARQTILYDVHDSLLPTITAQAASAVRHPSPAITRPESLYAETISSFATAGTATATATPTGRRRTTVYATASEGIDDDERSNGNVSSAPTDQGGEGDESNQHGGGGGTARLEPVRTYDDGRYQSLSDIAAQHNMPGLGDAVLLDFLAPIEQQQLATSASRGGSRIAAGGGGAEGAMGPASTMTMRGGGSIRARRITREEIAERGLVPAEEDHQGGGEAQQQQHEGGGLWTKLKHSVVGAGSWTWHATLGGLFRCVSPSRQRGSLRLTMSVRAARSRSAMRSYFFWSAAGAQGTERENEEDAAQTFRPSRAVLPRLTSALPLFSTATSSDGSAQHRSGLRVPRTAAGETTSRLSRVVYFDELGYMRDAFVEPWVLASSSGGWMR